MTICAVINLETNQSINTIIANESDLAPVGCKLVEIPNGYYWDSISGQVTMNIYKVIDTQEALAYGY